MKKNTFESRKMAINSNKSITLALETSGRTGSVAVGIDEKILAKSAFSGLLRHSAELLPTIKRLLKEINAPVAAINRVFIAAGPGSFTGIRIAVTTAKMLALATSAKIIPVDTMDAIAANANLYINDTNHRIERIATILDAKRKQFYIAVFERKNDRWKKIIDDSLMTSEEFIKNFASPDNPTQLLGEGLLYYEKSFSAPGLEILDKKYWAPDAAQVYEIGSRLAKAGSFADPITLTPLYLRQPEATENLQKTQKNQII